jgi:hypothetical protein
VPRSMRLNTAPGCYNPLTSDFDKLKLKILKQKKMASRSGWVQNIAFAATDKRFDEANNAVMSSPSPTTYQPVIVEPPRKSTTANQSFGTTAKRFTDNSAAKANELLSANNNNAMAGDINIGFEGVPQLAGGGGGSGAYGVKSRQSKPIRPKYNASNFVNKDTRYYPVKDDPGPAPGSYDLSVSWDKAPGAVTMKPPKNHSIKRESADAHERDTSPGPGDYNVSLSYVKKLKNRKNILLTTSDRFSEGKKDVDTGPNAQSYNPYPVYGSLIRPTHNVLLLG